MKRFVVCLGCAGMLAAGFAAAFVRPSTASSSHSSGCHSVHSCPSDHHTYIWTSPSGQAWDCAEPGAREYNPAVDTTTIVWEGLTYYCHAAGSTPAPPPTTSTTATTAPPPTTTAATTTTVSQPRCGVERWAVKTLSDADAGSVNFAPVDTTVHALVALPAPTVTASTPRIRGVETTTYRVVVKLVGMKAEDDHDIHLVVADPATNETMIVELPDAQCEGAATSAKAAEMASARSSFVAAEGIPGSSFQALSGLATITGVGFFDDLHGQTGVARNGIELHPALAFALGGTVTATDTNPAPVPVAHPRITSARFSVRAHRSARHSSVTEEVRLRVCAGTSGVLTALVAEEKRLGTRPNGKPFITAHGTFTRRLGQAAQGSCRTYPLRWPLRNRYFGVGYYKIAIAVRDSAGLKSNTVKKTYFTSD